MSEWYPIETAPKDGTKFIAIASDGVSGIVSIVHRHDPGGEQRNPKHHYECWVTDFNSPCGLQPTHWMPLPAPPAALNPSPAGRDCGCENASKCWGGSPGIKCRRPFPSPAAPDRYDGYDENDVERLFEGIDPPPAGPEG